MAKVDLAQGLKDNAADPYSGFAALSFRGSDRSEVLMIKKRVLVFPLCNEAIQYREVLHRLGIESHLIQNEQELLPACRKGPAELLFVDHRALLAVAPAVSAAIGTWQAAGGTVVLIGPDGEGLPPFATEHLGVCYDPLVINELLVRHLQGYSRKEPRVDIKLPGLVACGERTQFCEILSIGPGGAFIKTGSALPLLDSAVTMHIPLMGMRMEIEMEARVVRHVLPSEANNYLQGFGVAFSSPDPRQLDAIADYLRKMFGTEESLIPFNMAFCPEQAGFGKATGKGRGRHALTTQAG